MVSSSAGHTDGGHEQKLLMREAFLNSYAALSIFCDYIILLLCQQASVAFNVADRVGIHFKYFWMLVHQ